MRKPKTAIAFKRQRAKIVSRLRREKAEALARLIGRCMPDVRARKRRQSIYCNVERFRFRGRWFIVGRFKRYTSAIWLAGPKWYTRPPLVTGRDVIVNLASRLLDSRVRL